MQFGFPVVKNPPASAGDTGDTGSVPGSGRSPGEGNGNVLQYSCLGNPIDRRAWRATVHGFAEELNRTKQKVKEESEKVGLKFNILKTKIKASASITSWETDGEIVDTFSDFFWGAGVPKSVQMLTAAMKLKDAYSLEGKL